VKLIAEIFYKVTLITEVSSLVPLLSNVSVRKGLVKSNLKKKIEEVSSAWSQNDKVWNHSQFLLAL